METMLKRSETSLSRPSFFAVYAVQLFQAKLLPHGTHSFAPRARWSTLIEKHFDLGREFDCINRFGRMSVECGGEHSGAIIFHAVRGKGDDSK
jgi:hypothetical protein